MTEKPKTDFIRQIIQEDVAASKHDGQVVTRFPPEPNGFLHIGHAKSICLNFGLAQEFQNARCHLRFDDTNPEKEDDVYVKSIQEDIKWLGFDWGEHLYHASDYFEKLYGFAVELIDKEIAYVCELSAEEIRKTRGTLTEPGQMSPHRNRSKEENLKLFEKMRAGDFAEGSHVLRAKIDMASPNLNMRDPVLYRIRKAMHQRTGDKWCIYPMYDFAHALSDAIEGITHSICTLEFEDHRPLYDWCIENVDAPCHPQQIEFARLNLNFTVMSKRRLLQLVEQKHVSGWDDPRLPTLAGMRRRGFTPEAIRLFCDRIGIGKKNTIIDMGILEDCVRADLEAKAVRVMGVLQPLKIVIENYPEDKSETITAKNHPHDPALGTHEISFAREIFIERDDFLENPPQDFFRLKPGGEVRLRYAYVIECQEVIKNKNGDVTELRCTYDPDTFGGKTPEGKKKVKGIIHWVGAKDAFKVEIRLYDRLFSVPNPGGDKNIDFLTELNPHSLDVIHDALVDPILKTADHKTRYQFERVGYFCLDKEATPTHHIFNRIVTLRDTWAKIKKF